MFWNEFLEQALLYGLSQEEFWALSPREAYLAIKAAKAREDRHRIPWSIFAAEAINRSANPPKKKYKPADLYRPHLVYGSEADKDPRTAEQKQRELMAEAERLDLANLPVPGSS